MAKVNGAIQSSPAGPPPSLKKSNSGSQNSKNQKSILGFFQKRSTDGSSLPLSEDVSPSPSVAIESSKRLVKRPAARRTSSQTLTPAPSSDAVEGPNAEDLMEYSDQSIHRGNCLPSPVTPVTGAVDGSGSQGRVTDPLGFNSPSRKVRIQSCCCLRLR